MAKEIIVEIAEDGNLTIEGKGFVGTSCDAATRFLEKVLGKLGKRKAKQERWQHNQKQEQS